MRHHTLTVVRGAPVAANLPAPRGICISSAARVACIVSARPGERDAPPTSAPGVPLPPASEERLAALLAMNRGTGLLIRRAGLRWKALGKRSPIDRLFFRRLVAVRAASAFASSSTRRVSARRTCALKEEKEPKPASMTESRNLRSSGL